MKVQLPGRQFRSPGPVAAAFMADRAHKVTAILGPQGGGKTVACIHKLLEEAAAMPVCRDGKIHFRCVAIRDTYDRLEKTTIKTWTEWIPKSNNWAGGGGRAASDKLTFKALRGGQEVPIEFEIIFAAIGDQAAEDFMRGFECTAFWLNEMDLLAEDTLTYAIGRVGRYPAVHQLPPGVEYRRFIVGDLNAPDIDSWFYRRFEEDRPEGFKLYKQPSGRSPQAENLHNLVPGYYDEQVKLNASKPKWIKRFIDAEYGPSDDGEPVYPEYSDALHLARDVLRPDPKLKLIIGLDPGVQRPAAALLQLHPNGQWRVLGEVVPGRCGSARFCEALKAEIAALSELAGRTLDLEQPIYCDPFGMTGADREAGELAWAERVMLEMGVPIQQTETNEIEPRLSAVRDELTYMIDGQTPALLVSPRCKLIRKGFASDYAYKRQRVGMSDRTADKPDKSNVTADPHDALQYAMLGKKGRYGVTSNVREGRAERGRGPAAQASVTAKARDVGFRW